jgi:hypothetical protein
MDSSDNSIYWAIFWGHVSLLLTNQAGIFAGDSGSWVRRGTFNPKQSDLQRAPNSVFPFFLVQVNPVTTKDFKHILWLLRKTSIAFLMFEFREVKMGLLFLWIHMTKDHEDGSDEDP